ncbi:MAG: hypothetical protein DRH08_02540 [Deltaproteobacteria bacterium]|nr:MAG: hypothetical protein DRH08_02540 [Deltaproteobacteria bacterium]
MKIYLPGRTINLGRYGSLLLVLACLIICQPFVVTAVGKIILEALFIAALLAGLWAIKIQRKLFRFEIFLLVVSLLTGFAGTFFNQIALFGLGLAGEVLFLSIVAIVILLDLFRSKKVTGDTMAGAVCVYLLIALVWSYLYVLVELSFPGSFSFTQEQARMQLWLSKEFYSFFYFSLITMTTVGYGDMSPVSTAARTCASLEAILGQIYLTILVARLVGMHLVHQKE